MNSSYSDRACLPCVFLPKSVVEENGVIVGRWWIDESSVDGVRNAHDVLTLPFIAVKRSKESAALEASLGTRSCTMMRSN